MKPIRLRDVITVALVTIVPSYFFVMALYRWFPPITIFTGLSLAGIAIIEAIGGFYIAHKIKAGEIGFASQQLHPLTVVRSLLVAQASAWAGGIIAGFWLGTLWYLLFKRTELRVAAQDLQGTYTALASALALLVAAIWLQHCCKSPQDHQEPSELPHE